MRPPPWPGRLAAGRPLAGRRGLLVLVLTLAAGAAGAQTVTPPDCSGPQRWPAMSALVQLKNAGIADPAQLDATQTRVTRIASEQTGADRFRQVHDVVFKERSGRSIEVLTVNDASSQECSMGAVRVFLVSQTFGG